jgi:hypothetical protein
MTPELSRRLSNLIAFLPVAMEAELLRLIDAGEIVEWSDVPPEMIARAKQGHGIDTGSALPQ